MAAAPMTGRQVGQWRLGAPIGAGSHGAVYQAEHVVLSGEQVAVKVLHPHLAAHPEFRGRFLREAEAISRARHQHIVQVRDFGATEDGLCYLVMERLVGEPLAARLREGEGLGLEQTLRIGAQVASALSCAHEQGITHRDLKPENIFVADGADGSQCKVLDFGIAKCQGDWAEAAELRTSTGTWIGTPAYMSPEQWQGLKSVDGRADVYALGLLLYRLIVGELPFRGETPYDFLRAHTEQPVPEPGGRVAMPPALWDLIHQMLAKRPEERPQRMADVVAALQAAGRAQPAPRRAPFHRGAVGLSMGIFSLILIATATRSRRPSGAPRPPPPSALPKGIVPAAPPAARPATPPWPEELVPVGPGELRRGEGALPVARFAIARHEVSLDRYLDFLQRSGRVAEGRGLLRGIDDPDTLRQRPVNRVSRDDAAAYCRWRYAAVGGRLPRRDEWELAARGGATGRAYPWGATFEPWRVHARLGGQAAPGLAPVDSLRDGGTPQGLLHLLGNVAEWTEESWVCGGSADSRAVKDLAPGACVRRPPHSGDAFVGFRCAATPP